MSFISVLKKIGTIVVDAAGIITGVGPLIQGIIPQGSTTSGTVTNVSTTAVDKLTEIANIIAAVEATFAAVSSAATGPLKLQAAAPQVSMIIQNSAILAGHKIANPTGFNQGVVEVTQGVVDILNSLDGAQISATTSVPSPSATGAVPPPSNTVSFSMPNPTTPAS